jgi:hypothetical protein
VGRNLRIDRDITGSLFTTKKISGFVSLIGAIIYSKALGYPFQFQLFSDECNTIAMTLTMTCKIVFIKQPINRGVSVEPRVT